MIHVDRGSFDPPEYKTWQFDGTPLPKDFEDIAPDTAHRLRRSKMPGDDYIDPDGEFLSIKTLEKWHQEGLRRWPKTLDWPEDFNAFVQRLQAKGELWAIQ